MESKRRYCQKALRPLTSIFSGSMARKPYTGMILAPLARIVLVWRMSLHAIAFVF